VLRFIRGTAPLEPALPDLERMPGPPSFNRRGYTTDACVRGSLEDSQERSDRLVLPTARADVRLAAQKNTRAEASFDLCSERARLSMARELIRMPGEPVPNLSLAAYLRMKR